MELIKGPFLDTASHYDTFDQYGAQYASLLTSAALDRGDVFTETELAAATEALPEDGLCQAAEYWHNRVLPYLRSVWPKSSRHRTSAVSECLARLCIAAHDAFPEALKELRHWLQPPRYPGRLMLQLQDSQVCSEFLEPALDFLELVAGGEPPFGSELGECLGRIRSAEPKPEDDPRFRELRDLLRGYRQELE